MIWLLLFVLLLLRGDGVGAQGLFTNIAVKPGPSAAVYSAQPYYTCNTNRYVSTTGSSSNNGLTPGTAWDIPTAASWNASASGTGSWCINLAPGTYNVAGGLIGINAVIVSNGGTGPSKTGAVVWRCTTMPFSFIGGVLQGEGSGCLIELTPGIASNAVLGMAPNASFIVFDALEIKGINNNASLSTGECIIDALGPPNGGPNLVTSSHHIWVINSDLHGCGGGGAQMNYTDWLFFIHNVWHDNSLTNSFSESGFSMYEAAGLTGYTPTPGNPDYWHSATTGRTYNIVISYNVGFRNYNNFAGDTDGDGIIIDDMSWSQNACSVGTSGATCPYNGNVLIMGNIIYGNGGTGILIPFNAAGATPAPAHVDVYNNTTYSNGWDPFQSSTTFHGNLLANQAQNVTWRNNIAITVTGTNTCVNTGIACAILDQVGPNNANSDTFNNNIAYPGSPSNVSVANGVTYPTIGTNKNLDGTDPRLASLNPLTSAGGSASSNFALCTAAGVPAAGCAGASPAIGFGQAFDLWQSGGAVDAGACASTLVICP